MFESESKKYFSSRTRFGRECSRPREKRSASLLKCVQSESQTKRSTSLPEQVREESVFESRSRREVLLFRSKPETELRFFILARTKSRMDSNYDLFKLICIQLNHRQIEQLALTSTNLRALATKLYNDNSYWLSLVRVVVRGDFEADASLSWRQVLKCIERIREPPTLDCCHMMNFLPREGDRACSLVLRDDITQKRRNTILTEAYKCGYINTVREHPLQYELLEVAYNYSRAEVVEHLLSNYEGHEHLEDVVASLLPRFVAPSCRRYVEHVGVAEARWCNYF